MKKTLKIFERAYSFLEAAPFPEADAAQDPASQGQQAADPTMPAEPPPVEGEPEVQELTSQAEVAYIKKLINIVQSVITSPPDEKTRSDIANFNIDTVKPDNAREMLSKFENLLTDTTGDFETAAIDNKFEL